MSAHSGLARGLAFLTLAALCGLAASCVRYGVVPLEDQYVGPARAGQPAAAQPAPQKGVEAKAPAGQPAAKEPPAAQKVPAPAPPPISISVTQAIVMALQNNQALVVERLNPQIIRTFEDTQRAVFDPDVTASLEHSQSEAKRTRRENFPRTKTDSSTADVGVSEFLPTGTTIEAGATTNVTPDPSASGDLWATRLGLSVTQALLRGFGPDVNLASLRQARIDTLSTQYELRWFAESLVAQVEETYWDYVLAQRQIEIFQQSLELAEQQLKETQERINVGKLAEIERAAAEAEVAIRREDLINARSTLAKTRLLLLRLLNPGCPNFWNCEVNVQTLPTAPGIELEDVEDHAKVGQRMRPDLNQARLQVQRGDLEIVKTRNGLLPKLDLFAALGKTGYSGSLGGTAHNMPDGGYDVLVGVAFEYPPINRAARAADQRARLTRHQSAEAVGNMSQLVEVDIRNAYLEVCRTREQVAATAVTRKLQEETARAEMEKFRVGKSTTLLVAQAHRDLLAAQINEVQAMTGYLKAFVELYRLEGSLLERRGIECPGREPVEMPPERMP